MFTSLLDIINLLSLLLLLGGPFFYALLWLPSSAGIESDAGLKVHRRISRVMLVAGGLYLCTLIIKLLFHYRTVEVVDLDYFPGDTVSVLRLLNLMLVPVVLYLFQNFSRLSGHSPRSWLAVCAIVILMTQAAGSHSASEGILPYLSHLVHLLAVVIWAGGTGYFAMLPWQFVIDDSTVLGDVIRKLDQRLYSLILLAFIVVVLTGTILAMVHINSNAALHGTFYGKALLFKMGLMMLLILVLSVHLLRTGRMLNNIIDTVAQMHAQSVLIKYGRMIKLEAILITGVLVAAAALLGSPPPDTPPFLNPQTLSLSVGNQPVRLEMQPVAGKLDSVRMEIFLPAPLAPGDATQVYLHLSLPEAELDLDQQEALRVSADSYQGDITFPVPGLWQMELTVMGATGTILATTGLIIQEQPLADDISTYLSMHSILYNPANRISFGIGVLLVVIYGWLVWQARREQVPAWLILAGPAGILFGLYLLLSVALVTTYPTTYQTNPQPFTSAVVAQGQQAYLQTCADCHGSSGKGDGPWAISHRGRIPDLGSPHLDVHTDGEIYWWITRGIPELSMPGRDQELNEDQRWQLVNFIRSLRHGVSGS